MIFDPSCSKCELSRGVRSVCVPGRGSKTPRVVFIGQAPGRDEDFNGKCFTGPSGQLLMQAIQHYKLKPAYLTNLVKCFPPGDRKPTADEAEVCAGAYLDRELRVLKGNVILVPLGDVATRYLTGRTGITKLNGRLFTHEGRQFFPMIHPAYVLRAPEKLNDFERACKRLRSILEGERVEIPQLSSITTKEAKELVLSTPPGIHVAFDYETTGIENTTLGRIRCVGFSNGRDNFWVRADADGFIPFMRWFLRSDVRKTAHNAVFEMRVSKDNFGVYPKNLFFDSMAMHFIVKPELSHQLETVAENECEAQSWDLAQDVDYEVVDIDELGNYCALDAYWCWTLTRKLWAEMTKNEKRLYETLQVPLIRACARMEVDGVQIDQKYIQKAKKNIHREMQLLESTILCGNGRYGKVVKSRKVWNVNSTQQIGILFREGLKVKTGVKTDKGVMSFKADALTPFRGKHPQIDAYLKWKHLKTNSNNYMEKIPRYADGKGVVRASVNPCFIVSGRLSVKDPPMQTIPREPLYRGMVVSRHKKGLILSADYSQLEMRLVASAAGEKSLISAFKKDRDIHTLTAKLLYGGEITKAQRSIGKTMNFSVIYGISTESLAAKFGISMNEAISIMERFTKGYPKITTWMQRQHRIATRKKIIYSPFGRHRDFSVVKDMPRWQQARIERQAGNFPIQSAGADITNLSFVKVSRALIKMRSKVIIQHHDAVVLDVHPGELVFVKQAVRSIMQSEVPGKLDWLAVPLKVDIKHGERWGAWDE